MHCPRIKYSMTVIRKVLHPHFRIYIQLYLQLAEGELNFRNRDATASHLFIALSKHCIYQHCHQGAQNQHKQLPSHSYISTPQGCIAPVTVTRMFFTGSLATFFLSRYLSRILFVWVKIEQRSAPSWYILFCYKNAYLLHFPDWTTWLSKKW